MKTNSIHRISPFWVGAVLLGLLGVMSVVSLADGYMDMGIAEIAAVLRGVLTGDRSDIAPTQEMVLLQIRLPRIAVSCLVGAALAFSGAIFQGLLRNQLADPYTLGVSSGAALGASLVIVSGIATPWLVGAGAFGLSCVTLAVVIALAYDRGGQLAPSNLILAGVIVSAILSAALSFVKYLAGDQVGSVVFWLLGSFAARTWMDALLVFVFLLPAVAAGLWSAMDMNIMTMGSASARTLGVNVSRVRLKLLAAASLAAAAAVSVSGIIGFAGLIVPHLLRMLTGPDHRSLLPLSLPGGALLLLCADHVVRTILPGEIPVGVLTALLAGPVFLVLFRKRIRHADD